jgi:hypothetical protein
MMNVSGNQMHSYNPYNKAPYCNQHKAPLPPPQALQWYILSVKNFGPFPAEQLIQNGLARETFVKESDREWPDGLQPAKSPEMVSI